MPTRSGMIYLVNKVRQLTATGQSDSSVDHVDFWTDEQLQDILDRTRVEVWDEPTQYVPTLNSGGTTVYTDYRLMWTWLEETTGGTSIFYLRDSTGARIGTANYTVDYQDGRVTFGADQHGSARYVTARSYDVYEAAAQVWEIKAAHVANKFNFTADGATFNAGEQRKAYLEMANRMRGQSKSGGVRSSRMVRDDVNNEEYWTGVRGTRVTF